MSLISRASRREDRNEVGILPNATVFLEERKERKEKKRKGFFAQATWSSSFRAFSPNAHEQGKGGKKERKKKEEEKKGDADVGQTRE